MNYIIPITLCTILDIILIIEYIKDKKLYRLLVIFYLPLARLFDLPIISNNISKTVSDLFIILSIIFLFFIFYLILKDEKSKNETQK
ncbi:hypothetical protein GCM10008906_17390 [Clostridium oceanicum]|uniref:Uncharacterized protein n=1 Tax=Clostridium oceanicum TaxID=1543 RepID=A0ABP3UN06_9CLOT